MIPMSWTYKLEGEPSQIPQQHRNHPVNLRKIVVSKKTYKSKSVSQRKGKRLQNPKHDTMRVEQAPECTWEKSWETKDL